MFGILALVVTAGVCAGIVGVDSYRKQEYEAKQKNAEDQWKKAYNNFFRKTTNRSMESGYEQQLRKIMFGSKDYPEIVDEIKTTYKKWLNDEPYYIKYLGVGSSSYGNTFDYVFNVLLIILMANRGYLTTGVASGGIDYNAVLDSSQAMFLAKRLDEMLQKKGIHEDLYVKQTLCDVQRLSYSAQMGYTGSIYWKPKDSSLYL